MGIACNFIKEDGETQYALAVATQERSKLFDAAKKVMLAPDAENVWLTAYTPLFQSEVVNPQLDDNQEPNLETVVNYILAKNEEQLSPQENLDLKLSLSATQLNNSDELGQILKQTFIPFPTQQSLQQTGLYSAAEIKNILNSPQTVQDVQQLIYKIQNSPTVDNELYFNEDFRSTNSETNLIGRSQMENPYLNEQEAIQILGGIKNREEYETALFNSELEYLKQTKKDLFPFFSTFSNIPVKQLVRGQLLDKLSDTQELLETTLRTPENNGLQTAINNLKGISPNVWETSSKSIKTLLKDLQSKAADISLDLPGLETHSQIEIENFIVELESLIQEGNVEEFTPIYDEFVGNETFPQRQVVLVEEKFRNKNLIQLNTKDSNYKLFQEQGLLKIKDSVWIKTNSQSQSLEQVYNSIYQNILSGNFSLPIEYNSALSNQELITEDIAEYVSSRLVEIDTTEAEYDADVAAKMVLYSEFMGTELNPVSELPRISVESETVIGQMGISLNEDVVSEIREKQIKQSENPALQNLQFTQDGINLISTDPISIEQMNNYLQTEDGQQLRDYFMLAKDSNFSPEIEIVLPQPPSIQDYRDYYRNYPNTLNKYTNDYQRIDSETITVKRQGNFLKVGKDVYEKTDGEVYTRLLPNNSGFKEYGFEKPSSQINPLAFVKSSENQAVETRSLLSAAEKSEILSEIDRC